MRKLSLFLSLALSILYFHSANGQIGKAPEGYSPQIGSMVLMLEDLKERVAYTVKDLSQKETDFLLDEKATRVGALVLHLAATEKFYQVYTFKNRGYSEEEKLVWDIPMDLGDKAREELVGKPIDYYLKRWDEVRKESLRLLKTKDDEWFNSKMTDSDLTNHYAWYHVMEHQANHLGQILLVLNRAK
ncbi:MAG: DUF664 domain-containing protein [Bacteroidota bacterium]